MHRSAFIQAWLVNTIVLFISSNSQALNPGLKIGSKQVIPNMVPFSLDHPSGFWATLHRLMVKPSLAQQNVFRINLVA